MVKRILILVPFFVSLVFTASCWDRVEIEERGFVLANAIDLVDKENDQYILQFTSQLVIPAGIGSPTMGETGDKDPYMNLSASGESLFMLDSDMRKQTNQNPFYQHLKVIIISEDVVKEPHLFTNIMDMFLRDNEMRRTVRVVIAEGEAARVLDIEPKITPLPGIYLNRLMDGVYSNASAIEPVVIGDIHGDLLIEKSFVLPKIELDGDLVTYGKAGVFHGKENQLVGTLNYDETVGFSLITERTQGGMLDLHIDGDLVQLEMIEFQTDIEIKGEDKTNLQADINTKIDANIVETFSSKSVVDEAFEKKMEQHAAKKAEEYMQQTIDKVQGDLGVDVIDMNRVLNRYHHSLWKEVEADWDRGENYFSQMDITVSAEVNVERVGASDDLKNDMEETN